MGRILPAPALVFARECCKEWRVASRGPVGAVSVTRGAWTAWAKAGGRVGPALAFVLAAGAATALEQIELVAPGAGDDLRDALGRASLLVQARTNRIADPQDLFAAARADYGRLIGALYSEGHYGGTIRILIDGREAAAIPPLDAPETIGSIRILVDPGPLFRFGAARMRPYAPGTDLPPAYADGKRARSGAIVDAADAGVTGWRMIGHAKARVADQTIIADHRSARLDALILLELGPRLRFGTLDMTGYDRMDPNRLAKIAGFPTGEVFSPDELDRVATRLRRTGIFRSVVLREADAAGADGTLDVALAVVEAPLRRFGFGAEIASLKGLDLSGFWMHRNLLGGGERLRVDGAITGIGGQADFVGYDLGVRIDRPGTPVADASAFVLARATRKEVVDLKVDSLTFGFGLSRALGDHLTAEAGLSYTTETAKAGSFSRNFQLLSLPLSLDWDNRDDPLDARRGYFFDTTVTPFLGFGNTASGAQFKADARAYRSFGVDDGLVLAGRVQAGTVSGGTLLSTPPEFLFFSGGVGTVRGQPYQSLGVAVRRAFGSQFETGGRSFIGLSGEMRADLSRTIGAVAFYDAGYVGAGSLGTDGGDWHSGAGLGLRYKTGIGPIRLDVAGPVSGRTSDGVEIYIGIGQAF
ncbi:MAG: hypothetical protein CVT84_03545 [Alphaproteobacteria bacterium HGW-Alphaproteobacteria-6]|nr:MAG: hypothetical protein CVT84_03545 [Alphaproteobacteria bacterium HGW-Alphaproteobacteria-6]